MSSIKNIIAVASGKGGVGKSTVALSLALAFTQQGSRVGLLDADIYGPSQPTLLGIEERLQVPDKKSLFPVEKFGLKVMSIGFLVDAKAPVVWRGPMLGMALQQLLNDSQWGDLDYLVIDLPPGTGDVQLTLAQKVAVNGVLMVTTPQEVALTDVRRAIAMFEKMKVPILGLVENMAMHQCSHCGHHEAIFGQGGAESLAKEFNTEVLASFPLDKQWGEDGDKGVPTVYKDPEGSAASQYRQLAQKISERLAEKPKDYSSKFPKIKVEYGQ